MMSPRTIFLGKLTGLTCFFLAVTMISHKQATVDTVTALIHDAPLLFFACVMAMLAGLAIVLAHNFWSRSALAVVVPLFGWTLLIKGLNFLLLPPMRQARISKHFATASFSTCTRRSTSS
jgi:hypothetical protein